MLDVYKHVIDVVYVHFELWFHLYCSIYIKRAVVVVITGWNICTVIHLSFNAVMESGVFRGLWRSFLRPLLWQRAKAMVSEALVTGRNIITDMVDPKAKIRYIVRRNMTESRIE